MNYSKNRSATIGVTAALGALVFFAAMGACTEVDDRLGAGLIPKNQRMEIEVTSPMAALKTFLYREDSIPSSRSGYAWLGRTVDEDGIFGAQTSSALVQFRPVSLPYTDTTIKGYGLRPIVDSAMILLMLSGVRGDTTQVQTFDVWDVVAGSDADRLRRDSAYYTNFPIERYKGEKLFQFSHTGRRDMAARLVPTAAGKAYLNRIVGLKGDEWKYYTNDSLFRTRFQGLYITPSEGSPTAAALYGMDLSSSGIQLFVRNHDTLDREAIYDTLVTAFFFRDTDAPQTSTSYAQAWNNVSINMTSFDYSGSVLGDLEQQTNGFTDTLPTSTSHKTLYIQAMGGVGAYLRFTDELIEEIRNLRYKVENGEQVGRDIAINQAVMRIWLEDYTVESLDASIARLGSYLDPKRMIPIPDYQYVTERTENARRELEAERYGTKFEKYTLPYGGNLNRSGGYYELDITSYIQQLSRKKEGDPEYQYISPAIFIAPEAYGMIGQGESILHGFDGENPERSISIRISYTIIEG